MRSYSVDDEAEKELDRIVNELTDSIWSNMKYVIIEKARSHKYIKRTGVPGHFEYTYGELLGGKAPVPVDEPRMTQGKPVPPKDHPTEEEKDFVANIIKLDNTQILQSEKLPDIKGKGNELARRTLSVFGGNDLTPQGSRILKDMKDILDFQPNVIKLLPEKHSKIVLEYMRQNLNDKYDELVSLYNQAYNNIEKARPHKYIKRTGTPGHFDYFYSEEAQRDAERDIGGIEDLRTYKPELTTEDKKLREQLKKLLVVKEGSGEYRPSKVKMLDDKVHNLKSTQDAYRLGQTLELREAVQLWEAYKHRSKEPVSDDLKALERHAWLSQMYRETVEGFLGGAKGYSAFTHEEIEEKLGLK
jgi:hypothetical protein